VVIAVGTNPSGQSVVSASAFADHVRVAPVEVASAHYARHRLPASNCQLNLALHLIARTHMHMQQVRRPGTPPETT
jgi:hypothetical protein